MSLQLAAQHLAAQGRGPDKQLVHMSPREVAGLQALAMAHGGSLSINPETGLPEAGFLDNLLPAIIGAGLMFATGGAAGAAIIPGLSNAATIGLGVGALQTARTGDLGKGIMAGLGAYGGAGLTAGLAGSGMTVANPQAAQIAAAQTAPAAVPYEFGATTAAEQAAMQNALTAPATSVNPYGVLDPSTYADYFPGMGTGTPSTALGGTPITGAPPVTSMPAAPAVAPSNSVDFLNGMSDVSAVEGPGVAGAGLPTRSSTFASRLAAMPGKDLARYGLAAAAPVLTAQPKYSQPELDREQIRFAYNPGRVENPMAGYPADYRGEYAYFRPQYTRLAEGGPVEDMSPANIYDMQNARGGVSDNGVDMSTGVQRMASGGVISRMADRLANESGESIGQYSYDPKTQSYASGLAALAGGQNYTYDPATQTYTSVAPPPAPAGADEYQPAYGQVDYGSGMAAGGMSHLGDYSDGGRLLRGPGDGVSDSIPATIANKRPARLADGEFVVPARIVSELGNGSTEAGARKLYAMMDRVQQARGKTTGKGKVAKNTRADKYLPA